VVGVCFLANAENDHWLPRKAAFSERFGLQARGQFMQSVSVRGVACRLEPGGSSTSYKKGDRAPPLVPDLEHLGDMNRGRID
jgi:hypothetical protein